MPNEILYVLYRTHGGRDRGVCGNKAEEGERGGGGK